MNSRAFFLKILQFSKSARILTVLIAVSITQIILPLPVAMRQAKSIDEKRINMRFALDQKALEISNDLCGGCIFKAYVAQRQKPLIVPGIRVTPPWPG